MTSALLASQICVTTVLSLAKQRVNCPHACKINNMKGMNTFYLLLNYYRLLPMNKYAILFTRPDLHSPLHAAYRETEISRYHFYDLPVPNGQGINRATVSVLQCFLAPIRHRRWWCWSGTMWGYKWRVPGLGHCRHTDSGDSGVESRTHINSRHCLCWIIPGIPAPAEHRRCSHHNRSLQEFLHRQYSEMVPTSTFCFLKEPSSAIAKILNWFLNFKCNCL